MKLSGARFIGIKINKKNSNSKTTIIPKVKTMLPNMNDIEIPLTADHPAPKGLIKKLNEFHTKTKHLQNKNF